MRITSAALAAALTPVALALLAGCSGGSLSATSSVPGVATTESQTTTRSVQSFVPNPTSGIRDLSVSDAGTESIEVLNGGYKLQHTIPGLIGAGGDFIDDRANLYVADYGVPGVREYAPAPGFTPTFTYSAGLVQPLNVATDLHENVYVTDANAPHFPHRFSDNGFVAEYHQGRNTLVHQCYPGGQVAGLAVDRLGDVFVSYDTLATSPIVTSAANLPDSPPPPYVIGRLAEYKRGLAGCKETVLGATFGPAQRGGVTAGLQIDNKGNLVAAVPTVGVDIFKPPYTSISSTIPSPGDTVNLALNFRNDLMFIADPGDGVVHVDTYPGGVSVTTLGATDGISEPAGVATYPFPQ